MIIVRVELHPPRGASRLLAKMLITNDGTSSDPKRGNYLIRLIRKGTEDTTSRMGSISVDQETLDLLIGNSKEPDGEVKGYPRLSYHVLALVSRAIRALGINGA